MEQRGLSVQLFRDRGLFFVVRNCNITYKSPASCDKFLYFLTKLKKATATQLVFDQTVSDVKDNRLCVEAEVSLVCLNIDFKPTPIPEDLKEKLLA